MLQNNAATNRFSFAVRTRFALAHDYRQVLRFALLVNDTVMVVIAFALAYWLRFHGGITLVPTVPADPQKYMTLVLVLLPAWLILFWLMHLYDYHSLLGGTAEYSRTLNACTSGMLFAVIISFLIPGVQIARSWLVQSWLFSALLVGAGRFVIRRIAYRLRRHGYFVSPALIVGTNEEAVALANQLSISEQSGLVVRGYIANEPQGSSAIAPHARSRLPVLGTLDNLSSVIRTNAIEEIIIATTALSRNQLIQTAEQMTQLPSVQMRLSSGLYEVFTTGMTVTTKNAVPLMTLNRLRLDPLELILKRTLDITLAMLMLPFLLPVFGVIALLIHMDSPGPVFHRRCVLGVGGNTFDALKFRSMVTNGDEILAQHPESLAEWKANQKLKVDPRVTRVGRWLRRTSLDELPQLFNVLVGQMSLVGPRMITPDEAEKYGTMQHNLLTVKPGLTGLWQVSGRADLSYEDRVRLDMHYIRNYSMWQDLQILFLQTIPTVLGKKGAY